ncbi:MAG: hypothetical protein KatS3mg027_1943 [Bacteroidia bacterium]|nr:MAG: hypothetical protein KatS3mg027_1943 [Bacteroidia bacterium]
MRATVFYNDKNDFIEEYQKEGINVNLLHFFRHSFWQEKTALDNLKSIFGYQLVDKYEKERKVKLIQYLINPLFSSRFIRLGIYISGCQNVLSKLVRDHKYNLLRNVLDDIFNPQTFNGKMPFEFYLIGTYNYYQMIEISSGFKEGLSLDKILFYSQLNSNCQPIYNHLQMHVIRKGFLEGLTDNAILKFARLDKNKKPIFNHLQMNAILKCYLNFPQFVDYISRISKNEKPSFDTRDMFINFISFRKWIVFK